MHFQGENQILMKFSRSETQASYKSEHDFFMEFEEIECFTFRGENN